MNDHNHADTLQGATGNSDPQTVPAGLILGSQYLRTLSIDIQNTPDIYRDLPAQPHLSLTVDVTARQLDATPPAFEAMLVIRVQGLKNAPSENDPSPQVLYSANIAYAGLFGLSGTVRQSDVEPLLLVHAPAHLFPNARILLLNTIREAGFPTSNMQPIDFQALYLSRKAQ